MDSDDDCGCALPTLEAQAQAGLGGEPPGHRKHEYSIDVVLAVAAVAEVAATVVVMVAAAVSVVVAAAAVAMLQAIVARVKVRVTVES